MTLTIEKRYNGKGEEIDETYRPVIPELIDLLSQVYHRVNNAVSGDEDKGVST